MQLSQSDYSIYQIFIGGGAANIFDIEAIIQELFDRDVRMADINFWTYKKRIDLVNILTQTYFGMAEHVVHCIKLHNSKNCKKQIFSSLLRKYLAFLEKNVFENSRQI